MTTRLEVAYVSTFPPRQCGLATFTSDLTAAIDATGRLAPSQVVAINHRGQDLVYPAQVSQIIVQEDRSSYVRAANFLNRSRVDVVVVQHEFGIFGGTNGNYLLSFLSHLRKPVVTTFHTVLPNVDSHRKALVQEIAAHSAAVVVPAQKGKEILTQVYKIAPGKIHVIHHGVPVLDLPSKEELKERHGWQDRQLLCTFGLLHPGKGIEFVLQALPPVVEKHPEVLYLILGQTHPEIIRRHGEAYRNKLENLVTQLGLKNHVRFVNSYLSQEELLSYLQMTDIYITPYLEPQQISSGTLAYAVCLGKAIISTPYLYAQEMLAGGRGILVPFADAEAMAVALEEVLADPRKARALSHAAREFGRQMTWPQVAEAYVDLVHDVVAMGRQAVPGIENPATR
ncbi:MAG: glycosyltransferase family 4 protein [Moorellales bacterium]